MILSLQRKLVLTGIAGLLILGAVAIRGWSASRTRRSAADLAHSFYLSALDHRARFDLPGMMRNIRASWTADPTYLPAISEVVSVYLNQLSYMPPQLAMEIDSLAAAQSDSVLGVCIRGLLTPANARMPLEVPPHASGPAKLCAADHRLGRYPRRGEEQERAALARALWRRYPDTYHYARELGGALWRTYAWQELDAVALEMSDSRRHPFVQIQSYSSRRDMLHYFGRHEEAARLEREADAVTRRGGGAVRLAYLLDLIEGHAALLRESGSDSALATHARAVMTAGHKRNDRARNAC